MYIGASPIIAPPQPALSPAAKKTRRPTINRSPAIPKIPQNPANPASDNPPFPPLPKGSADQPSTGCPQSRKSPKILQILLQTIRPFPRCQKDPPPNHQPLARNPENPPKSCKSCFRQPALSPAAKKTRRPTINRSPAIPKISQNPANPASDNLPFPPPQKRPAAQPSTARPQSRKSPKILQILLQTTSTPILRCTPTLFPTWLSVSYKRH